MESDCQFLAVPPQLYAGAVDDDGRLFSQQHLSGDPAAAATAGRGGGGERKRRFTEEQVRSLEATFLSWRAKALEPREKAELARELGLQPRQVSIWFQNKRARWRSKQLEQDFADLRAHYDALRARVESLKQEKLALAARLEELREKLNERPQDHQSAAASCVDSAEVDDKRNSVSCVVEEDSAAGLYDHLAYGGGQLLPETFCATPELWAETWPPVEWNLVA